MKAIKVYFKIEKAKLKVTKCIAGKLYVVFA